MSSIIPVAILAGVWYHLARQGITTTTVWLGCNLLDTFRALRLIRHNGRAVGQRTRRKAMRDSLICWTSFVLIQQLGGIPDKLLGWLPVYSLVRSIVVAGFLFARVTASETIYTSLIQPTIRQYEIPIDLSIEFVSSVVLLIYHFTLEYPLFRLQSAVRPYVEKWTPLSSTVKGKTAIIPPLKETTTIDLTHIDDEVEPVTKAPVPNLSSTPKASRIQSLIQDCEKRSPARLARDERPRVQSKKPQVAPQITQPSSDEITIRPMQHPRSRLATQPPIPASTTTREPSRPTSTRLQAVPVRATREGRPQPIVRQATKAVRTTSSVLTETRPAPTASDANIVRADPPLVKSKSINHLKPAKPYVTDITAQRPVKSAPTRRVAALPHPGDDPNSPRAKKLAHAAERAREIRERRRREPGVAPGEKRPPPTMNNVDAPGSKRTRISVVRD